MSQIDPESTSTFDVPCVCPKEGGGLWHEKDTVTVRDQYGYGDLIDIQTKSIRFVPVEIKGETQIVSVADPGREHFALMDVAVKEWTFCDKAGEPVLVEMESFRRLPEDTGNLIAVKVNAIYEAFKKGQTLPNPSSGRSQPSPRGSSTASPNRATRRAAKRSTSKS